MKFSDIPPRLRQAAQLVHAGLSDKQIAHEMGISTATAKVYLRRLKDLVSDKGRIGTRVDIALAVERENNELAD